MTYKSKITAILTNTSGTIIAKKEINGEAVFDIHDKSAGTYILKILLNGEVRSWKVIKL